MGGIIKRLTIYPKKGTTGIELAQALLVENLGLEGDCHARGGERQLSLRLTERNSGEAAEKGLCFSRFKENITIQGLKSVEPGTRYTAGEAILEISGETKHCYGECALFRAGERCSLAGLSLFAKVLKSGTVRVGDRVELY